MTNRLSCRIFESASHRELPCEDCDPIWNAIQAEALAESQNEPILRQSLERFVLGHSRIDTALGDVLAEKLLVEAPEAFRNLFQEAVTDDPSMRDSIVEDLKAIRNHDPAVRSYLSPFLHFKGFLALEAHRLAHWLWSRQRTTLAQHIQSQVSQRFGVDIHPAARLGQGVFIDHATGVVIGETAVVGDNVVTSHQDIGLDRVDCWMGGKR